MKRIFTLLLVLIMIISLSGCGKQEIKPTLNISQMKTICELATMECYYHNVAKFKQEDTEGFWLWKKDTHFWIEYDGVITLGVDVAKIKIDVSDTKVTIWMPQAEIFDCDISDLDKENWIIAKNSAKITADDENKAITEAQAHMRESAENNTALLNSAQERAKELLEQYIKNIGNLAGVEYTIKWETLEEPAQSAE